MLKDLAAVTLLSLGHDSLFSFGLKWIISCFNINFKTDVSCVVLKVSLVLPLDQQPL